MIKTLFPITIHKINYLIDKENPKDGEYYICIAKGKGIDVGFGQPKQQLKLQKYTQQKAGPFLCKDCCKVIACEYPHKIEGLYQYKLPDEDINKLAEIDRLNTGWEDSANLPYTSGFIRGYKANKTLYTENNVVDFLKFLELDHSHKYLTQKDAWDDYKNSLHKNKEIESVEVEWIEERERDFTKDCNSNEAFKTKQWVPKLDKDDLLKTLK